MVDEDMGEEYCDECGHSEADHPGGGGCETFLVMATERPCGCPRWRTAPGTEATGEQES